MACYARREAARLNREDAVKLLAGQISFGDPPVPAELPGAAGGR
jgi:hypothetical protein